MFKARNKTISLIGACFTMFLTVFLAFAMMFSVPQTTTTVAAEVQPVATFMLGANGTASHYDGTSKSSHSETVDGYTLSITGGTNMYTGARDAKGNSCIKLGSSKNAGSFQIIVPNDIAKVIIYIAKYKANTSKVTVNGTSYTLSGASNDGVYDEITVDTSSTKTVTLTTVSGGIRAMVNTIEFYEAEESAPDSEEPVPECEHANMITTTVDATCTEAGSKTVTCDDCDETISTETLPATGHSFVDGICENCGEEKPDFVTLVFDDTEKRTEYSTSKQVWKENGITVTNNKGSSTSNVGDYVKPARFYKSSEIILEYNGMGKIEFTCSTTDYATALKNSIGGSATVNGQVVTVEFDEEQTSFTITLTAQVRMDSITVYASCSHQNTTTKTVDVTCTEDGSVTETCDSCNKVIYTEIIKATGHSLDEWVTTIQPTVGKDGEKTRTCQNCDYTETESVPALDATKYTLSFSVPNGVVAPESVELAIGESVVLNTVDNLEGFTFIGWVVTEYKESKLAPEMVYEAGNEYTLSVEDNVTLYALYSYSAGSGNYVKVTEAPADWSGEYLIVYEGENDAYIFNCLDASNGYISASLNDSMIAFSEELKAEEVTIAVMDDGYSIKTKNGYLYGVSGSNSLKFNETEAQLNTISFNNGNVDIVSNTSHLRFNSASKQMRFRYYKSESYAAQKAIQLYRLDSATYYSTNCTANIDSASVTLGEDIMLNYYVSMPQTIAEQAAMYFTVDGETYDAQVKIVDGRYVFSLPQFAPQYMTLNISAELKVGDDVLASKTEYSIQEYAQNMLNDTASSDALKRLVSDMLYYGAAAQKYRDYNMDKLATDGVENLLDVYEETPTTTDFTLDSNPEISEYPAWFKGAGVWFDSENKIYVKINTTENVTLMINGETVEVTGTTIYTDGIKATGFADTYTFTLYHDGVLMQTLTYSINAYANAKQDSATMGELALALYRYGVSAVAYQGAQK